MTPQRITPLQALALTLAAGAAAAIVVVWATFALAGLISGNGTDAPTPGEAARAIPELWNHRGDPSGALPPTVRQTRPRRAAVYAAGGIVLLCTTGALVGAGARLRQTTRGRGARFARAADLRGLRVTGPTRGRVILGRHARRLVAAEERHSVLIIGPTQSGKTTGLVIPAILEHDGPLLATSSKPDVLEITHHRRADLGPVLIYDPIGVSGHPSAGWTPLHDLVTWDDAQAAARALMSAGAGTAGVTDESFWRSSAELLLAPLLRAAVLHGEGMAAVVRWLSVGPAADDEVSELLQEAEAMAAAAWDGVRGTDPRTRSSVTLTARTVCAAWWDQRVLSLAHSDITPERILSGASVFLVAPPHEQQRLAPVFAAITTQIIRHAQTVRARGTRPERPLLCVLDEAAHIAPIRELPEIAATGADAGVQLISVFQDTAQITHVYRDRARTVLNNHRARIFLGGIADQQTLTEISRSLGDLEIDRTSTTRGHQGSSTTTSRSVQPLAPVNALRELPAGQALLLYGHRAPAMLRLRPWFKERGLKKLVGDAGET
ncbi:MAG: type IV secretory system conjugative DNA transfer family protein [Thermoleophilia bacterium]